MAGSGCLCVITADTKYSGLLQELLDRIPAEVGPSRHAHPSNVGKQAPIPPIIKDKRNELLMNSCLSALVKRMVELHEVRLKACHCVEEFHLR
jgi:hypothetical protein